MPDLIKKFLGNAYTTALGTSLIEPFVGSDYDENRSGFLVTNLHASQTISVQSRSDGAVQWIVAAGETKFIPLPGTLYGGSPLLRFYCKGSGASTTCNIQQVLVM